MPPVATKVCTLPDLQVCQGEFRLPRQPFKIGFPAPRWQRCDRRAVWLARETRPSAADGLQGAMSLCRSCRRRLEEVGGASDYDGSSLSPVTSIEFLPLAPFRAAHRLGGDAALRVMVYQDPLR